LVHNGLCTISVTGLVFKGTLNPLCALSPSELASLADLPNRRLTPLLCAAVAIAVLHLQAVH
jgi:hypothetical protein